MTRPTAEVPMWTPSLGDVVWMNYPDMHHPEGKVVGFVPEGQPRAGQPVIERIEDHPGAFSNDKKGDRVVIAPMFLLPFEFGGTEWQQANADGLVR